MDFEGFVLAASTADLGEERRARAHANAVEFRMDLAPEPLDALDDYDGDLPVIATNRASEEGGGAGEEADARLDALAAATAIEEVTAIDVELAAIRAGEAEDLLATARDRDVAIVASAHDFEGTPSRASMAETLRAAGERAAVGKLAVTATSRRDALALLGATHELDREGERVATMAMGEPGRHTRALAPLYGSTIGYAPVDASAATAPGQYDLETLASLLDRLRGGKRDN